VSTLPNHFTEGQDYRADELGEAKLHGKRWRMQSWIVEGLLGVAVLGLIVQGNRPHWKPYYVEINTCSGDTRVVGPGPEHYVPKEATARAAVRELVETLRGIGTDKDMMRERWKRLRVRMTKEGRKRFLEWEAQRQPLRPQAPVKVEILRSLLKPGSSNTWDVRWQETDYGVDDRQVKRVTTWSGLFSYKVHEPWTPEEREFAPDGIFFDFWQWSQE